MIDLVPAGWDRRDFLRGATLLALAVTPGTLLGACKAATADAPSERQRKLLTLVSDLVIPRTGTAGAGEVGVGDFVVLALAHGLENSREVLPRDATPPFKAHLRVDGSLDHGGWLEAELDRRADGDFLKLGRAIQAARLAALDATAYAEGVRFHPWRTLKALVLTGYYTSQVGGSQELSFELVPGRFDADVPVTSETRAWSSDWTAVDFG